MASAWMLRCTPPRGVPQLCPARWFEVAYLEPEEAFVEASYWSGVRAVDSDADPSIRRSAHVTSLLEAETKIPPFFSEDTRNAGSGVIYRGPMAQRGHRSVMSPASVGVKPQASK